MKLALMKNLRKCLPNSGDYGHTNIFDPITPACFYAMLDVSRRIQKIANHYPIVVPSKSQKQKHDKYRCNTFSNTVHLLQNRDLATTSFLCSLFIEIIATKALQYFNKKRVVLFRIVLNLFQRRRFIHLIIEKQQLRHTCLLRLVDPKKRLIPFFINSFFPIRFSDIGSS